MKKLLYFACSIPLVCLSYSNIDFSNAAFLADQNLIVKQSSDKNYRLDDTITRAEVVGMALKIKGIPLPESYECKEYFSDVTKNDWICRAVELAADEGLVSKDNTNFRPGDYILRVEALSIIMKAGGIKTIYDESKGGGFFTNNEHYGASWEQYVLKTARQSNIIDPILKEKEIAVVGDPHYKYPAYYWRHDEVATRAEVFGFTKNIYVIQKQETDAQILDAKISIIGMNYQLETYGLAISTTGGTTARPIGKWGIYFDCPPGVYAITPPDATCVDEEEYPDEEVYSNEFQIGSSEHNNGNISKYHFYMINDTNVTQIIPIKIIAYGIDDAVLGVIHDSITVPITNRGPFAVISPNAGEKYKAGQDIGVKWQISSDYRTYFSISSKSKVSIWLVGDNGIIKRYEGSLNDEEEYIKLPKNLVSGGAYKIIVSVEVGNGSDDYIQEETSFTVE